MCEGCPVSAPLPEGVFHLLAADDNLASPFGGLVTVCGEVVNKWGLPSSCYSPGLELNSDPRYCPECVHEALRWSAETGESIAGGPPPAGRHVPTARGHSHRV